MKKLLRDQIGPIVGALIRKKQLGPMREKIIGLIRKKLIFSSLVCVENTSLLL